MKMESDLLHPGRDKTSLCSRDRSNVIVYSAEDGRRVKNMIVIHLRTPLAKSPSLFHGQEL